VKKKRKGWGAKKKALIEGTRRKPTQNTRNEKRGNPVLPELGGIVGGERRVLSHRGGGGGKKRRGGCGRANKLVKLGG